MNASQSSCSCGRFAPPSLNRREMLRRTGLGLGSVALAWLLGEQGRLNAAEANPVLPLELTGKAKRVIMLYMNGGVSQVDSFDPKPALTKYAGQSVPDSIAAKVPKGNVRLRLANLYPSPFEFQPAGQCGMPVSSLFPGMARHVDDLCLIRSMRHDSPIHTPADYLALTGSLTGQRPSLGAWLTYGLGSENANLPAFVAMIVGKNFGGPALYGPGFLPPQYQATVVESGKGVPDVALPSNTTSEDRRAQLDLMAGLERRQLERLGANSELEARITSYEMAFRMQASAPDAFELRGESEATRKLYGIDQEPTRAFGSSCLLARRLVERGVRFVQLIHGDWDAHSDLKGNHLTQAQQVDTPIGGLLTDLKSRGLLEDTLVIWTSEFGRTPTVEGDVKKPGRDHNPAAYLTWLAGAGIKGGQIIGATDEVGYTVVDRPIHPNDLHATILKDFGIDQQSLYYLHNNRKELVTNNGGEVVSEVFA